MVKKLGHMTDMYILMHVPTTPFSGNKVNVSFYKLLVLSYLKARCTGFRFLVEMNAHEQYNEQKTLEMKNLGLTSLLPED